MKLPDDIKIHIYTFLHMDDVKKIEKKERKFFNVNKIRKQNKTEFV